MIIGLLCCHFDLFSQVDSTQYFNLSIEELMNLEVYSASKKKENIMEAPSIITIVPKKDIEKMGVYSLIDVLKYVPGFETSMGSDGNYRVSIRGNRNDGNILVLINGQPTNNFYNGRSVFDFPLALIEKIEIIRGPGSALFGTNAVAGVIHLFLIEENVIGAFGGLNNTFGIYSGAAIKKKEFTFSISGLYQQSDGSKATIEQDAGDKPGNTWNLTYDSLKSSTSRWNKDGLLNVDFYNKKFKVYSHIMYHSNSDYAGNLYILSPGTVNKQFQNISGVSFSHKINEVISVVPKFYYSYLTNDNLFQERPSGYISNISNDTFVDGRKKRESYLTQTFGAEMDFYIKLNERWNLLSGNVFEEIRLNTYDVSRNYKIVGDEYLGSFGNYDNIKLNQKNKRRFIFAYFIQADYSYDKIDLTIGLRYDDYNDFGSSLNPRMGINYKFNENIRLKGLYGKAFRAPTFKELYDNTNIGNEYGVKGNDTLKPESIQTFELALEGTFKKFVVRYNGFYNYNTNLIRIYDPHGSGSIGVFQNIGVTKTYGHELEINWSVNKHFDFYFNFCQFLMDFRWTKENVNEADYEFYEKLDIYYQQMFNIPRIRINSGLHFHLNKFSLFAGLNYGGASFNNHRFYLEKSDLVEIPPYLQANFNLTYAITSQFTAKLMVQNLGKKYTDPDESTNIDVFGGKGLIQANPEYFLSLIFKFKK